MTGRGSRWSLAVVLVPLLITGLWWGAVAVASYAFRNGFMSDTPATSSAVLTNTLIAAGEAVWALAHGVVAIVTVRRNRSRGWGTGAVSLLVVDAILFATLAVRNFTQGRTAPDFVVPAVAAAVVLAAALGGRALVGGREETPQSIR